MDILFSQQPHRKAWPFRSICSGLPTVCHLIRRRFLAAAETEIECEQKSGSVSLFFCRDLLKEFRPLISDIHHSIHCLYSLFLAECRRPRRSKDSFHHTRTDRTFLHGGKNEFLKAIHIVGLSILLAILFNHCHKLTTRHMPVDLRLFFFFLNNDLLYAYPGE